MNTSTVEGFFAITLANNRVHHVYGDGYEITGDWVFVTDLDGNRIAAFNAGYVVSITYGQEFFEDEDQGTS